ncbi:hypothetical protein [Microbacterium pumilum]|uniref:SRPBCC family protein n=1 Tax=Microbacterium pumilum TaxID=344165 RepID=A0ABN2T055_9MICO
MTTTLRRERVILTESFDLPLARRAAFRLFTARGERLWVAGWSPEFFADIADDLAIGTVFRTYDDSGRATTWVVVDCELGHRLRYARVVDEVNAGTVEVTLEDIENGCRIAVTYDLTSTDPDSDAALRLFADGYGPFIRTWAEMIQIHLDAGGPLPDSI